MRFFLVSTVLAATFALGSCQSLHFLARRDGPDAPSSSFFRSFSWVRGQDGQMHKQTETSSTEFGQDGTEMKKNTVCTDGVCREVIQILQSPPMQEPEMSPCGHMQRVREMPAQLRGILDQLIGQMQYQREHEGTRQPEFIIEPGMRQPELIIEPMRLQPEFIIQPGMRQPELIIEPMRMRPMFPDNRNQVLQRIIENRIERVREAEVAEVQRQKQLQEQQNLAAQANDMKLVKRGVAFIALIALVAAYAVVMSVLKCWRLDQVSARERPLREFSEPLAPADVNIAIPAAATRTKLNPVRMYVSGLYARTSAKAEARGVQTYLGRLYGRIFA